MRPLRLRSGQGPAGFTLLEVVVALAILAMSLMAIFDLNSSAIASHAYAKRLTIATMLARSKMEDVKQKLYDDGFSTDDQELEGDFSDEGWESFKWKAKILAPRTGDLSPDQLMGALFGLPPGMGGLDALFGGGGGGTSKAAKEQAEKGGPVPDAAAAMGPLAGMAQAQIQQLVSQINQTVREIHLNVTWPDGKRQDSLVLVTHLVANGPGSDRNGAAVPGQPGVPGQEPNGIPPPGGAQPGVPGQPAGAGSPLPLRPGFNGGGQ
jgi:general secretion pathway protein I